MSKPKYWSSSCGRIEIPLFKSEYTSVPVSGRADESIAALIKQPKIINRFDKYADELIVKILVEYGAWEPQELTNRKENIERILWIACLDLQEGR